jgi:diguanylate cyclase (GGDEF)-like protein/PAS domain S-box-containing protein
MTTARDPDVDPHGARARVLDGLLRKVSEHVPGVLYQFLARPDGTFAFPFATPGMRDVYGVAPEDVRDDAGPVFAALHPDDLERVAAGIERSRATLDVWRDTYRVQHPKRGERWLHGEASPERLPDGGVLWHGYISDVTELREAQEALVASEAYLQDLFAATEAALFVVDVDRDGTFRYLGSNAAHARTSAIPMEDLRGRAPHELLPADVADAVVARYRGCVERGEPVTYEEQLPLPVPGTWYRTSLVPVRDGDGRVVRIVGSGFDITARRRAEHAVRERDALLERAQRVGRLGTWAYDPASGAASLSPAVEALVGPLGPDGVVNELRTRVADEDRGRVEAAWSTGLADGRFDVTFRVRTADGMRFVRLVGEREEAQAPRGRFVGTLQDVDAATRREAEVARLARIVEQAPSIVVLTGADGTIEYVNRRFEEATGHRATDVVGQPVSILTNGDADAARDYEAMWPVIVAGGTWTGRLERRRANGTPYQERATFSPLFDPAGRLTHVLKLAEDVTEQQRLADRVDFLSSYDPLTGLANRAFLEERLGAAIAAARRHGGHVAVMVLDLDAFKTVNDGLGHRVGDALLAEVATRLRAHVRADDLVARFGGDEFVVVLDRVSQVDDLAPVVAKLREGLEGPVQVGEHRLSASASIGVAVFPDDAVGAEMLLRHADAAMERAKERGPGTVAYYTEALSARLEERVRLEAAMRTGFDRGEFRLVYQPRVDMASRRVVSLEALARWRSPTLGDVPPGRFVAVAESSGFIHEFGAWVTRTAATQLAAFREAGLPVVPIAVNLSVRQFLYDDVVHVVERALADADVPPGLFEVEITESTAMTDVADTVAKLRAFERLGVAVSIDDFGTYHSSLGRLKRLAVKSIKIDRGFVMDLGDDPSAAPHDAAIVRAMIGIGEALGLAVVAEGVETEAQRDFLLRNGCRLAQGYLFARPGEVDQVAEWLRAGRVPPA